MDVIIQGCLNNVEIARKFEKAANFVHSADFNNINNTNNKESNIIAELKASIIDLSRCCDLVEKENNKFTQKNY